MSAATQLNASTFSPSSPALSIQPRRSCVEVVNRAGATVGMFSDLQAAQAYIASQTPAPAPAPAVEQAAAIVLFPCSSGGWIAPSRSVAGEYHHVWEDGGTVRCSCKGFHFNGRCVHASAGIRDLAKPSIPTPVQFANARKARREMVAAQIRAEVAAGIDPLAQLFG